MFPAIAVALLCGIGASHSEEAFRFITTYYLSLITAVVVFPSLAWRAT